MKIQAGRARRFREMSDELRRLRLRLALHRYHLLLGERREAVERIDALATSETELGDSIRELGDEIRKSEVGLENEAGRLREAEGSLGAAEAGLVAAREGRLRNSMACFDALYCVVLDDIGTKCPIESLPEGLREPTAIVESSPGNYQYVYRLSEPLTDLEYIVERYGQTHVIIGNIDTRILQFGTPEEIRADVKRCADLGRACPGYFFAVGNHIPYTVPIPSVECYLEAIEEYGRR